MAARKGHQFSMSNEHRTKIQNSQILKYLIEHAEGRRDMTATQVTVGLGLLRKIMPDLAATADTGEHGALKSLSRMTDDELEAIAAGSRNGTAPEAESPNVLN